MEKLTFIHNANFLHESLGITDSRVEEIRDLIEPALDSIIGTLVSDSDVIEMALEAGKPTNLAEHTFIVFVIAQMLLRHDQLEDDPLNNLFN